ncbi:hypothetical protein ACFO4E_16955 [Nocardiopsis mangrovi]|uniref:Uncharacterized protein n=1 Tax=Nocardiopsis mangrovi TaxID=1179818 RepID=A0ABV9E0J2_9ACTN
MALRGLPLCALARRALAGGAAVAAALALTAAPAAASPAASAAASPASPGAPAPQRPDGPVVLVGVPGLLWEEMGPRITPNLWGLAEHSAIGDMSIRTVTSRTCPVDGWLTVSAGERASSERQRHSICELPVPPEPDGDSGAVVGDYGDHVADNAASSYAARVGLLGQAVRDAGGSTLAVGPGAALAAADAEGRVDRYLPGVEELERADLDGSWLAVVDLDDLADLYLDPPEDPDAEPAVPDDRPSGDDVDGAPPPDPAAEPEPDPVQDDDRLAALSAIDAQAGRLLDVLPEGSPVLVAGVSVDAGASKLTAALMHGPGPGGTDYDGGFLTSESTRREGLVTLTDTTTTLLHAMALPTQPGMVGRAWLEEPGPPDTRAAVDRLADFTTAAQVVQSLMAGFFSLLVAIQLLIYAAAAYALHRYGARDRAKRAAVLTMTRTVALGGAAFPVSSYLANLIPWWSSPVPQIALPACVLLTDVLVVAVAVAGPWRRDILGPMTVVAGVTTAVLFIDTCTGANLQMNSPTGYTAIVGGRFYGLGNIASATFATGMLMAVAGVAHALLRRGLRAWALAVPPVVGAATLFVVGWPGLGTDFGGVLALVPGLTVTVLMIAGRRVTAGWMAGVAVLAVLIIGALSYLDYLRPPSERSHFGLFADQIADGAAWTVLDRKLEAMLGSLGNWQLTLLSACALLFLFVVLNKPTDWKVGALQRAYEYAPTLRAGLTGSLVSALAGFAVNDSGIAIPALALTVAVPLALSACAWALQQDGPGSPAAAPAPPADAGAPAVSRRTPPGSRR